MEDPLLKTLFLVVLSCAAFTAGKPSSSNFVPSEYLGVPASEFVGTVRSTIDIIRQVISMVSQFGGGFGDFRLTNAISDCLDLMDLSMDQLSWTLSASQNPNDNSDHPPKGAPSSGPGGGKGSGSGGGGGGRGGRKLIADDHQFPGWLRSQDRNLLQAANGAMADVVVAADGTGNFTSINDAVHAAPEYSTKRFVIYIKRGVYKEYVEISKKKWNIMMIGDGVNVTVISGNRNFIDGWTTYRSATFAVKGQGFIARDITFENTAGPEKHQAVAFRSDSDLSVLYRCAIRGYQDTLYAHSQRQFYRECIITGTVDFIFGDGAVVFQNCQIQARKGLPNQKNTITAQGRKEPVENTGFSIQFCNISVEPDVLNSTQTYLGRPWKLYSRTVIMQSYISNAVRPEGWLEWNGDFALNTLFYGEYMNYGPGSGLGARVKWSGYHVFNSSAEANNFTVSQFIIGNTWLPSTGVKYTAGLGV
ncbi:UNVERIFIED_CONTAM: Pectinesterase/pectinesterase inhibitor PPE8B [Sesamum latifolium]|uniref:Pectinesterase n=1 Tax=Sesamum latifolium TaxID=2727402 RepID=A0AAW2VF25_9LAMI